jgi:hypothetical protein
MVFDALGVSLGNALGNTQGTQKGDDSLVPAFTSGREIPSFVSEKNCPIRLRSN